MHRGAGKVKWGRPLSLVLLGLECSHLPGARVSGLDIVHHLRDTLRLLADRLNVL